MCDQTNVSKTPIQTKYPSIDCEFLVARILFYRRFPGESHHPLEHEVSSGLDAKSNLVFFL
jgi:hypothetical protein